MSRTFEKKTYRDYLKRILTAISPKLATTINYRYTCGEWLNWKHPQDINAKINWLKIYKYYNNPRVTMCIDKYAVREFLKEKGFLSICPILYGVYDKPEEIEWDKLPNQFVVKCNHACGTNIIVKDKSVFDEKNAVKQLARWMKMNYWKEGEVQYKFIKKKIIVEEYLGEGEDLKTVKIFCFNGEPKVAYISMSDDKYIDYFTEDFKKLPYVLKGHENYPHDYQKPDTFDEMMRMAQILSEEFPFVRVDFYDSMGKIYISELTFVPTGGYMKIEPYQVVKEWGEWLTLPEK